jgi:uncharacterized ParB-like nuclease family protein
MKHTLTITEEHLDKALSQPWSTRTCLIATAAAEKGYKSPMDVAELRYEDSLYLFAQHGTKGLELMQLFDEGHNGNIPEIIETVRKTLPVTLEVETK